MGEEGRRMEWRRLMVRWRKGEDWEGVRGCEGGRGGATSLGQGEGFLKNSPNRQKTDVIGSDRRNL